MHKIKHSPEHWEQAPKHLHLVHWSTHFFCMLQRPQIVRCHPVHGHHTQGLGWTFCKVLLLSACTKWSNSPRHSGHPPHDRGHVHLICHVWRIGAHELLHATTHHKSSGVIKCIGKTRTIPCKQILTWFYCRNHGRCCSSTFRRICMCQGQITEWECKKKQSVCQREKNEFSKMM